MREVAVVAAGGAIGAAARYAFGTWAADRFGAAFPWHTLAINVGGAFLLGLLMALSAERGLLGPGWRIFAGVGILGGFTTFSTLAYESIRLVEQGSAAAGLANMFGSGVAGLAAAVAGLALGRLL